MQMKMESSPLIPATGKSHSLRAAGSPVEEVDRAPLIREELSRILQSRVFSLSSRMRRFLRFAVEATLEGRADSLKEYVIGTEVYDRKPPYDPSQDSIVRTEARRLRSKLKEYYESEGKTDPVFIGFRAGSYVPVFAHRESLNADRPPRERASSQLSEVLIAAIPFEDVSEDIDARDWARALSECLAHQFMMIDGCRVIEVESVKDLNSALRERSGFHSANGAHLVLQGTLIRDDQSLRVTARLADADGFQLWSIQFHLEANRKDLFRLMNQVASALTGRLRAQDFCCLNSTPEERTTRNFLNASILAAENSMDQDSPTDWRSIQTRFANVVRSAPRLARAHCGIANCLVETALSGIAGSREIVLQAKHAVLRALEYDAGLSAAHACLGLIHALECDFAASQRSFENSCSLGPGAVGHRQYALLLAALGRFEDAWHHLQKAQSIDPFSCRQKAARSRILYLSRRYEELVQEYEGLSIYGSKPAESQLFAAHTYLELGQPNEARQVANRLRCDARAYPELMAAVAEILARCGDFEFAMEITEHFKLLSPEPPIGSSRQALLALALGDKKGAINALIDACEKEEAEVLWLRVDPRFDAVRDSPCVRSLDAWSRARYAKPASAETPHFFPRYSCLDLAAEEPRVA